MRRTEDIGQLELSMNFLPRRDGITRAVKQRAVKFYLECAVQHFYPLGLQCDQKQTKEANKIERNINGKEFQPQPNAAAIAAVKMKEQMED